MFPKEIDGWFGYDWFKVFFLPKKTWKEWIYHDLPTEYVFFSEFSCKYPFGERRIWVLDDGYVLCAASTSAIKVSQAGMPQNNDSNGEFLNVGNVINQPNFDGLYMFIPPKKNEEW